MATTSPDNLRTPDPGDPYNLVPDLATLSGDVQTALNKRSVTSGTVAQRTAFTLSATNGWLWQDTDDIKMIWRKDGAVWVPAVWRWSGTNTQMTGFAPPDGFEWFNTTDTAVYLRFNSAWVKSRNITQRTTSTFSNTTSTNWQNTDLYHTITPRSASSRILITASFVMGTNASNEDGLATLFRGNVSGVNLGNGAYGMGQVWSNGGSMRATNSFTYLDSPGTTSPQLYTLGIRAITGTINFAPAQSRASITLEEIP